MADYTFSQLEGLWISAGGNKAVAPIMAAIALAESSGNPNAINPTDNNGTQTSWGLWQISNGTHNQPVANILNPQVNAQQAVAKYDASGFAPWGTYASGAYLHFLPKGYVAPTAANPTGQGGVQTTSLISDIANPFDLIDALGKDIGDLLKNPLSVAESLTSIAQDVGKLSKLLNTIFSDALWLFKPSHWIRIFAFIGGISILLPGVYMLSKAGKGEGDLSLALGILLTVGGGLLLFVAFHSLPESVKSLKDFAAYLSSEVRANSPATTH